MDEIVDVEKEPGIGPRELCLLCPNVKSIAIIKLIDGRLCFQCFQALKKASGKGLDDIHEMSLERAKSFIDIKPEPGIVGIIDEDNVRDPVEAEEVSDSE